MSAPHSYSPTLPPLALRAISPCQGESAPGPITGVSLWVGGKFPARKIRCDGPEFQPGHWALSLQNLWLMRFRKCAWGS